MLNGVIHMCCTKKSIFLTVAVGAAIELLLSVFGTYSIVATRIPVTVIKRISDGRTLAEHDTHII